MCVKLNIEQAQRSEHFRIQSEITERAAVTEGKVQNAFTKRKTGECFQWKANGSCSKGDSCSFLHSRASGNRKTLVEEVKNARLSSLKPAVDNERRRKGKEQASSSVPTGKGQTDDKRSTSPEARPSTGAKIPCLWGTRCKRSSCDCRHLPVCRNYKSGNRCIHGSDCLYPHAGGEKPSKKSKNERTHGADAILKEKKKSKVVYLTIQIQRSLLRKTGQTRLNASAGHAIKILRTHLAPNSNSGKKRAISRRYPKRWTSWAKSLRADVWGNFTTRRARPQCSVGLSEKNI